MYNTKIPLDILWLDENYKTVFIKHNAQPYSRELIKPDKKAKYVLELKGGTCKKIKLKVGLRFDII
jgi:hypothetical protein